MDHMGKNSVCTQFRWVCLYFFFNLNLSIFHFLLIILLWKHSLLFFTSILYKFHFFHLCLSKLIFKKLYPFCYWKPASHGRKQVAEAKGDMGASLPPSCDMSGVTRRGGGIAWAQHWAGKRKSTPHPVAVATWGRPVRFSLWSRWYAWSALRLTGISQPAALLLTSRLFVLWRTRWASSNKNKRENLNKQMKIKMNTIKRKLGKLEKMLLLLGGESSVP